MIIREKSFLVEDILEEHCLKISDEMIYKESIFFDLEHYVYRKPICIGVFGSCYYDSNTNKINITQYMIENKEDSKEILKLAKEYFEHVIKDKKYIVTFSGNNDFTVIKYLFQKYKIDFDISSRFIHIDIQKEYEKCKKTSIGLKALEKEFDIQRESELISGQNLAKTFSKLVKDEEYINRMPNEKKEKILLYNEQDVVSLFYMSVDWNKIAVVEESEIV
ncbi:ribonuclease H-like domain-containing protein [Clostridium malenominatum]|uniref:Ribonuclease H-like domain-containing protein n=2 Tax=Clostridium malenominatum TaxID=1539 RepID=A0ABP3U083_9CLOT